MSSTPTRRPDDSYIGFKPPGFKVDVRQTAPKLWELLDGLHYTAAREEFDVRRGEPTDFASVPRIFSWFIPTYGKYTKAAILHDHLCALAHHGRFSRRDADRIFCQAMRVEEVAFLRRWVMWTGVRLGALLSKDGRKDWYKDAPRVLPIAALAAVVLLPPAVLIVLALAIWYGMEWIAWLVLTLHCQVRTRDGGPSKRVNQPRFSMKL